MVNSVAPEGMVFVCLACGKRSRDKYGFDPINRGWDVSCMINSELVDERNLVLEGGRVVQIAEVSGERVGKGDH